MSANFENKKQIVAEITQLAKEAKAIVLVDYRGLTVEQVTELRNAYRQQGAVYKVYKNRLMKIAFESLGIKFDDKDLEGTTAVAFGYEDEVAPAKIVKESATETCAFAVKFGIYNNQVVDANAIKALASIPAREVLLAQLVGMLSAPMRNLAVVVKQIAEKN